MKEDNVIDLEDRGAGFYCSELEKVIREGAQNLLMAALQNEVAEYIDRFKEKKDEKGYRLVTRNGSLPEREIQTGIGRLSVKQPRVYDRREGHSFTSHILPSYMRRTPSLDALIPALYLKGVSTGDMQEALEAIVGANASGLSATNIVRLKEGWMKDYEAWNKRDLSEKRYVYFWADGIYFNVRLEKDRPCILVIMGALSDGTKELVAVHDGQRESKLSWQELLRDVKERGLPEGPELAIGDGGLGFWAALEKEYPGTRLGP